MKKRILAMVVSIATVLLLVFSSPISAERGSNSSKPGHGQGDTNHGHYGPPGQNNQDERPGWGYGDKNHDHYGYGYGNKDKDEK